MKDVLIACEESQTLCSIFYEHGFNAFSCDIQETSGIYPGRHILGDVTKLLDGYCSFFTQDGVLNHLQKKWDLIIAHPPCTYLTNASSAVLFRNGKPIPERYEKLLKARDFFMLCLNAACDFICVENPVPVKIAGLPCCSQIINPYEFGEPYSKRTCLWLKNLPPLLPTLFCPDYKSWVYFGSSDSKRRSRTFIGIANAMFNQWSNLI